MRDRKKTEITVGFASHFPSSAERALKHMEKADVILVEMPAKTIKDLARGASMSSLTAGMTNTEYEESFLSGLKQKMEEGKMVKGYESVYDPSRWTKDEFNELMESNRMAEISLVRGDIEGFAKNMAKFNKMREIKTVDWIKRNMTMFRGKRVYIEAGGSHTGIYHMLKKDLGSKGVTVRSDFIDKSNYGRGTLDKFAPSDQMIRMIRFGTPYSKDPAALARLAEKDWKFRKIERELMDEYRRRGLSRERANEMAHFGALRKFRRG